ncbi:MAG: DUF1559 domain-containing protein [Planctomycetota bacterium]|nr:DUF1559 domain-containing protein [Planctomycetota bacterium]
MRKIIIAFHNVVDVTKRFPAASILGPDGKTPHSWRVAILRYLGDEKCNDLYKQYKFDESWDSPANMKVLEQMPDVYRDPTDDPKSTNSRYFVLTGKDLMFSAQPAKSGKIFRDITDGTSKTIFLAESKENVPWTKPEDLPVEAGKPLPKLSTTDPRYYRVGFFDGGVRKVSSEIDDATLWKMITPAGGETVDPKELDGPAKGADATVGETFHPKLDLSKLPKELAENEAVQKVVALIPMVDRGTRGDRAKHQNEVHALFAKFPEVKTLLHHVANGEVPGASDEQKFYAAMTLGEMGRPTVIGPNSVGDYLRNYIQLHTNMRLGKRLKLDPALNDLIVEVPKDKERDKAEGSPTFQELLWKIVSKYKLGYKIEDDTLVITKGTAVENASKNLAGNKPFDLTYVPSDVTAILAIRPAVILAKNPELRATLAGLKEFQTLEKEVGMPLDELESLLIFPAEQYRVPVVVLRSEKPTDWKAFLKKAGWKNPVAHEYAGETVYQVKMRRTMEGGYWIPDQHTIVITWQHAPSVPSALGISIVTAKAKLKPAWGAEFEKVATSDIAFYINGVAAANNTDQMVKSRSGSMGSIWAVLAFFRQVPTVIGAVDISDKLGLRLEAVCENDRRAKEVNESAVAIRSLVQSMLPVIRRELFPTSRQAGEELEKLKDKLFDSFGQFLARLNPQQEGSRVTIKAELQVSLSVLLKDFLLPGIAGMRKATIAAEQANRLRQIALAFHTYHDAHKQFPPAVILGPDGKTPHSWRVALLPYLEMGSLYNAYKFDQPWDSPANLELMKAVPDVFCDVTKYPKNTNSSYYVLTGKDAMFSAEAAKTGTTVRQIKDGLSNTILVVEAERDIPWTKPEDIPVEKDKPLPELRSPNPLAYRFAFADGSVQQLPSGVMEETIRKLITPAGGEVVHRESELEYVPTPKPDAPRP